MSFFFISSLTNICELIKIENVTEKCIFLHKNNEYYISICHDDTEHD